MNKPTIQYKVGDLLAVEEGVIIHGCNCKRVMGSGVALQIKKKYPGAYGEYMSSLQALGDLIPWRHPEKPLVIVNALTQNGFGSPITRHVSYDAVDRCLDKFVSDLPAKPIYKDAPLSINFPRIGAGLGGGNWAIISAIIEAADWPEGTELICWDLSS